MCFFYDVKPYLPNAGFLQVKFKGVLRMCHEGEVNDRDRIVKVVLGVGLINQQINNFQKYKIHIKKVMVDL